MTSPAISPHTIVEPGAHIGTGTRIWSFVHICSGAVIGEDCNLCDHTFFEQGVRIGNRVTVKCGVHLWDGVTLEDDVFVGPGVAFTNDLRPRSGKRDFNLARTILREGCSIGANATLLPVTIGRWALVGAGSVVTQNIPDFALVRGNPARTEAWICRCATKLNFKDTAANCNCGRHFRRLENNCVVEIL